MQAKVLAGLFLVAWSILGCQTFDMKDDRPLTVAEQALQKERLLLFQKYALRLAGAYQELGALGETYDDKGLCGVNCNVWNFFLSHDDYRIELRRFTDQQKGTQTDKLWGEYQGYIEFVGKQGNEVVHIDLNMDVTGNNQVKVQVTTVKSSLLKLTRIYDAKDGVTMFATTTELPSDAIFQALIDRVVGDTSRQMDYPPTWSLSSENLTLLAMEGAVRNARIPFTPAERPVEIVNDAYERCMNDDNGQGSVKSLLLRDSRRQCSFALFLTYNPHKKLACIIGGY